MRSDIELSFIEVQMPRTPYQLERFVIGQHDTAEMQFVQVCRELEALYYTLKEVGLANKKTELEINKKVSVVDISNVFNFSKRKIF